MTAPDRTLALSAPVSALGGLIAAALGVVIGCGGGSSGSQGPSNGETTDGGSSGSSGGGSGGSSGGSGGSGGSSGGSGGDGGMTQPPCNATGFAATGTAFALPPLSVAGGLRNTTGSAGSGSQQSCTSGSDTIWTTLDLAGHGPLDLVLTSSCSDAAVGTSHWLVYPGSSTGFAANATSFALPSLSVAGGLRNTTGSAGSGSQQSCSSGSDTIWTTLDLTGDGALDLVLTSSCSDATVGTAHWLVYPSGSNGFAASATSFALPSLSVAGGLRNTTGSAGSGSQQSCSSGSDTIWTTLDLTGDGALDLVLTSSCSDATVGTTHWLVYPGSSTGFAASATPFALPSLSVAGGLRNTTGSAGSGSQQSCSSGSDTIWTTFDLTGEGTPDLVLTSSCSDAAVGTSHWLVYPGSSTGFAASATPFALPSLSVAGGLRNTTGSAGSGSQQSCSSGSDTIWTTFDLTGDGPLDLVLTSSCSDAAVGTGHWLVYAGSSTGFAATGAAFALPSLTVAGGLRNTTGSAGSGSQQSCSSGNDTIWTTFALTGHKAPDLVLTSSCSDATVGTSQWLAYSATCKP